MSHLHLFIVLVQIPAQNRKGERPCCLQRPRSRRRRAPRSAHAAARPRSAVLPAPRASSPVWSRSCPTGTPTRTAMRCRRSPSPLTCGFSQQSCTPAASSLTQTGRAGTRGHTGKVQGRTGKLQRHMWTCSRAPSCTRDGRSHFTPPCPHGGKSQTPSQTALYLYSH